MVSIHDDDAVRFTISAFSRPGDAVTRMAGPIARAVQSAGTTGYLKALQRFVNLPGLTAPDRRAEAIRSVDA